MRKDYIDRIIDSAIERKLKSSGALMIVGPKDCGKTTTAKRFAKTMYSFDTKDKIDFYSVAINNALKGEFPILIDEWQNILKVYDLIRIKVDEDSGIGEFILTGSTMPIEEKDVKEKILHSGAGRFSFIEMYPLSLYESGESLGNISLSDLFDNKSNFSSLESPNSLDDMAYYICRGGWPFSLKIENKNYSLDVATNYLDAILNTKTNRGKQYFESIDLAGLILKEYARTISSEASTNRIVENLSRVNPSLTLYKFNAYIEKFKQLYLIKDLPSWNPNLRSKVITRTSETKHFVDPSIATAILGISPNNLLNDLNTFGLLFEDLVARDLRVYSEYSLNATLRHYRDKSNLEVDVVITRRNDDWAAIEVKLGGEEAIKNGINNLRKLKEKIDYEREKQPSFMAVITSFGSSYKTEDGIYVFPITQLKD